MQPCFGLGCIIEGQRMSFTVGGHRFDAMVSPEGQEHWAIQQYTAISPKTNFKYLNAFADETQT